MSEKPKSPILIIIYYHYHYHSHYRHYYYYLSSTPAECLHCTFISINSTRLPRNFFEFLRVRHSLAERYRSIVVSIRFGEKGAFFQ